SAHGKTAWQGKKALSADLAIDMEGSPQVQGTITFTPDCSKVRIDLSGGTRLVMDGQHVWISPSSADTSDAARELHMWPFLIAVPFKLNDTGTTIADAGVLPFG